MAKKAGKSETSKSKAKPEKAKKPAPKAAPKAAPKVMAKVEKAPKPEKIEKVESPAKEKPAKAKTKKEVAAAEAASEANKKWLELREKHGKESATKYNMTGVYVAHTPLQHDKLGWGYILSNNNDRLEVLFETGTKILISNYQPAK